MLRARAVSLLSAGDRQSGSDCYCAVRQLWSLEEIDVVVRGAWLHARGSTENECAQHVALNVIISRTYRMYLYLPQKVHISKLKIFPKQFASYNFTQVSRIGT